MSDWLTDSQALDKKFEEELSNPVILVSMLLDPRFRTFQFHVTDPSAKGAGADELPDVYAAVRTRVGLVGQTTLETRMFTAAVKLYQRHLPMLWTEQVSKLPTEVRRRVEQGDARESYLWADLKHWACTRADNLRVCDAPLTLASDPLDFWRACNSYQSIKPLAMIVLAAPASAISVERLWSSAEKILDKRRASLALETAGRQVFVRQVWRIAQLMSSRPSLADTTRRFYESLLPFGAARAGAASTHPK